MDGVEVYLISSAEELYDYLALQMVDGVLREIFRRKRDGECFIATL